MKLYLASPWKTKADMPAIAEHFERAGHVITHKWWLVEDIPEDGRSVELLRSQAQLDVTGVQLAEAVVLINSAKSEGKAIEQGIAIDRGRFIIAIGKRGEHSSNIFHYLRNYRFVDNIEEALHTLEVLEWIFGRVIDEKKG